MKKLFVLSLAIMAFLSYSIISEAQKKEAAKQKDSSCVADCSNEHKKCIDASKKVKKTERKGKLAECDKLNKDCKAKCDKAK